jgi:hypothetical protein
MELGTPWLLAMAVAAATITAAFGTTAEVARAIGAGIPAVSARLDVFAAPDGTFWMLTAQGRFTHMPPNQPGPLTRRGVLVRLRHLDGRGHKIGQDVTLNSTPGLEEVDWAYLLGFRPGGGLYLRCSSRLLDPTWDRLAIVDTQGVIAITPEQLETGYIDRWLTVVSRTGLLRSFHGLYGKYCSFAVAARNGVLEYVNQSALGVDEAPSCLRWRYPWALAPSGQDAFVSAVYREGRGFSVYRFDFESLALRDSGFLPEEDVWRVVNVPVLNRPVLVPSDSGFWLYAPPRDPQNPDLDVDEQAKQMRVYRIGSNLQAPPTTHKAAVSTRPYSRLGPGATRLVRIDYLPTAPGKDQKVRFDFWAYGSDGQLYHSVETVPLRSRPR